MEKKEYKIIALDDKNRITGNLNFKIEGKVTNIQALLVAKDKRKQGIGKKLMLKAEEVSKKRGAHKILLETAKKWESVKFYKSLGYRVTGKLPNHYFNQEYVIFTKFI